MKKFFGNWNPRKSSSGPSTSQRESFQGPGGQCWGATSFRSFGQFKSYKAFGKIHKAACQGDVATIQGSLILGKIGTNDRDRNDRTILHYACAHGHPDVVALLIEWNCDIDPRDSDNSTALIKASQYEHEECAAILLEHGADPNAMDNNGNTALHYAIWHNNTSMAAKLLSHHADISIRNEDSFTPLILALLKNNKSLAKFLVDQRTQIMGAKKSDSDSSRSDTWNSCYLSKEDEDKSQEFSPKLRTKSPRREEGMQDQLQRLKREDLQLNVKRERETEESEQPPVILDGTSLESFTPLTLELRKNNNNNLKKVLLDQRVQTLEGDKLDSNSSRSDTWNSCYLLKEDEDKSQEFSPKLRTKSPRREEGMQDQLQRLKCENLKLKVKREHKTEESEQPQVILDGTSLVIEKADNYKVNRLQAAENLNHSWVHASEDRNQSAALVSENENHSASRVSENLDFSAVHASENLNHSEVTASENVAHIVVHEVESPNHNAAALFLQKQDEKAEEQPVPAEKHRGGSIKNTSNIKNKVNEEANHMFDSKEVIPPHRRKSADCEMFGYDTILDLVEQLRRQSKDSDILLIIWCAIHSYKRSMELQNHKFEMVSEKNENLKDHVNSLKRDLSESNETKLELQVSKAQLQGELSNMRLVHKNSNLRDRVRQNTGNNEQLLEKSFEKDEKQLSKYTELNQSLKYRLDEEWKKNKEYAKELTRVKNIFKMRQKSSNEQENKRFTCPEDLNTNQSEANEINLLKHKIDLATGRLHHVLFNCERIENENQILHQKLVAMRAIQEKCKMLEDREEKLNQELLILETHMQKNMIDQREAEMLKQETEERCRQQLLDIWGGISLFSQTQSQAHEQTQRKKESSLALKISDMECRIKDMESKLSRAKAHEDSVKLRLGIYKQCYQDQLQVTASLSEQIDNASKSKWKMQKDSARLTADTDRLTHSLTRAVHIPEETGASHLHHRLEFSGNFTPSLGALSHQYGVRASRPSLPRFL